MNACVPNLCPDYSTCVTTDYYDYECHCLPGYIEDGLECVGLYDVCESFT